MPDQLVRSRSAAHRLVSWLSAALMLLIAVNSAVPALAAPTSPAPTTPAGQSGATSTANAKRATFGLQPATHGKPDGRPTLAYGVTPGGTFVDHVAVVNFSLRKYTLAVYAADAINDDKGNLTLLAPGKKSTDAGSWITLGGPAASGHVSVRPRSYVVVRIRGRVPANASPGDHVAGIVADLTTQTKRHNVNVQLHQRVGLRTFIRVAGAVRPGLAVENLSVKYHNNWNPVGSGGATVTYRVHNVGNVILGAKQKIAINGLFGQVASATPPTIPLLLPGGAVDVTAQLAGVTPEVWMTAKVQIDPVVPSGNVDAGVQTTSASKHFWAVPWLLIGIIVVLGVGGVLASWWRRKRRSPGRRHTDRKEGRGGRPAVGVKEEISA